MTDHPATQRRRWIRRAQIAVPAVVSVLLVVIVVTAVRPSTSALIGIPSVGAGDQATGSPTGPASVAVPSTGTPSPEPTRSGSSSRRPSTPSGTPDASATSRRTTTGAGRPSVTASAGSDGRRTGQSPRRTSPTSPSTQSGSDPVFRRGPFIERVGQLPVDPRSRTYVQGMVDRDLVVSLRRWTVPVWFASPRTPRYDVSLTSAWFSRIDTLTSVPIPNAAKPDPEADGHMTVVDQKNGCVYDLYHARRSGDGWTARWANALPISSAGVYPDGLGTRASGFSAGAGLIWPAELERGHIDHALVFAYPLTKGNAYVSPATHPDGKSTDLAALPMGARVRLDPTLDLSTLGLSRSERVIARALQEYGMVLGDTSGGFTLYAASPLTMSSDPYQKLFHTSSDWAALSRIPLNRLQVIELPPTQSGKRPLAASSCARFR